LVTERASSHLRIQINKSIKCLFLGLSQTSKPYCFLNKSTNKAIISRDALFVEEEDIKKNLILSLVTSLEENDEINEQEKDSPTPRRSTRVEKLQLDSMIPTIL